MTFVAGQPKHHGRKAGTPNKFPVLVKDAIVQAATNKGKGNLVAFFESQIDENPAAFLGLIGRVIPLQLDAQLNHHVTITAVTHRIVDDRREQKLNGHADPVSQTLTLKAQKGDIDDR